jgi:hypothetical protein
MHGEFEPARYRWSGRVRVVPFFLSTVLVLATAALMAWLLHLAYFGGWYLIIIAPLIAALPVAGMMIVAVVWGHCRNPVVAATLGLFAGLVVSPGHYQCDFAGVRGWQHIHRLDRLPDYILFRMDTDVMVDLGRDDPVKKAQGPNTVDVIFNWFFLILETVIAVGFSMAAGIQQSLKVYGERRGRWMTSAIACLPSGAGRAVAAAMRTGRLADLADALTPMPTAGARFCELMLHYVPGGGAGKPGDDDLAFLTIKEVVVVSGNPGGRKETVVAAQWQVAAEDLDLLATHMAAFAGAVGARATPVLATPAGTALLDAEITPVPEPHGGTVLTRGHLAVGTVISLSPLLLTLGAAGLIIYTTVHWWDDLPGLAALGLLSIATTVAGLGFWFITRYADYLPSCYLYRLSKHAVAQRTDALVEADNPETIYVQVVPRQNWARVMIETATDVGFLWIDQRRRQVLFEGDRERWRIPAEAILSCEVEHFILLGGESNGTNTFYLAVLRARLGDAVWEAPLTTRHIMFYKQGDREREEDAHWLRDHVHSIITPPPQATLPDQRISRSHIDQVFPDDFDARRRGEVKE